MEKTLKCSSENVKKITSQIDKIQCPNSNVTDTKYNFCAGKVICPNKEELSSLCESEKPICDENHLKSYNCPVNPRALRKVNQCIKKLPRFNYEYVCLNRMDIPESLIKMQKLSYKKDRKMRFNLFETFKGQENHEELTCGPISIKVVIE